MTCHNCWCPTCNAERALWALKPFAPYIPGSPQFVPVGPYPGVAPLVFGEPVLTPNFTGAQSVAVQGQISSCTCGLQDSQTCSRAGCPRKLHR